ASAGSGGTLASGINNLGQIVGYYAGSDQKYHGFVYNNGAYSSLDDPATSNGTVAAGINDSGQIAGNININDPSHPEQGFLYSGGTFTAISYPSPTPGTGVSGINNAGQVVGIYSDSSGRAHSFIYSGGTYTNLPDNPNSVHTFPGGSTMQVKSR